MNNNQKRSSFNPISGDTNPPPTHKALWYINNIIHNVLPQPDIGLRPFKAGAPDFPSDYIQADCSPGRVLFNHFILSLPITAIKTALGPNINVLDCGCGTGLYFNLIDHVFDGVNSYHGFDLMESDLWKNYQPYSHVKFYTQSAEKISPVDLKERNLIISQSAVEHFAYDLTYFEHIADYLKTTNEPNIQIHLLPAANMWRLYGVHGYRGYNTRALKKILEIYDGLSECEVFSIGGQACNTVHKTYIRDTMNPKNQRSKNNGSRFLHQIAAKCFAIRFREPSNPYTEYDCPCDYNAYRFQTIKSFIKSSKCSQRFS